MYRYVQAKQLENGHTMRKARETSLMEKATLITICVTALYIVMDIAIMSVVMTSKRSKMLLIHPVCFPEIFCLTKQVGYDYLHEPDLLKASRRSVSTIPEIPQK